jgi:hypothetical protein
MQNVHNLYGQHYGDFSARLNLRQTQSKFQLLAAFNHMVEHVIDCVLVYAGTLAHELSQFRA